MRAGDDERRIRLVVVVIVVSSCASCASLAFAPLAPFLVESRHLSYVAVAALNSAVFVGAALASPSAGRWVDRLDAGPALTLGLVLMAAAFAAAGPVSASYAGLLVVALLAGLAFALVNPAANVAVGTGFPAGLRGTVMGVKQTGISLGGVVAGLSLPTVAAAFGWRAALYELAALLALAAAVSAHALGVPRRPAPAPAARRSPPPPGLVPLWSGGLLLSCPQAVLMTYLVLYVMQPGRAAAIVAGGVYAAVQLAALLGRVGFGAASDFLLGGRRRDALVIASVGAAAATASLALVPASNVVITAAVAACAGLTAIGWNGVYMAALVELAPRGRAGAASGVGVGLNLAAVVVFPLLAGQALDAGAGFGALWLGSAAFALAAAACFAFVRERPHLVEPVGKSAANHI